MSIESYLDNHPTIHGSLKLTLGICGFVGAYGTLTGTGITAIILRNTGMIHSANGVAHLQAKNAAKNFEEGRNLLGI